MFLVEGNMYWTHHTIYNTIFDRAIDATLKVVGLILGKFFMFARSQLSLFGAFAGLDGLQAFEGAHYLRVIRNEFLEDSRQSHGFYQLTAICTSCLPCFNQFISNTLGLKCLKYRLVILQTSMDLSQYV